MSTNVLHAPQTIGFGARRLAYLLIGLVAVALVVIALVSSSGSSTVSGSAVSSGRAVAVSHPNEAATAAAIGQPEPNLLPK